MNIHRSLFNYGVLLFIPVFIIIVNGDISRPNRTRISKGAVLEIDITGTDIPRPEIDETVPSLNTSVNSISTNGQEYSRALTYMEVMTGRVHDTQGLNGFDLYQYGYSPVNIDDFTVRRVACLPRNASIEQPLYVQIVNSLSLLKKLGEKNDTSGRCVVVLFYAPWCPFCANISPHFNAIGRAFHQLDILAIDAVHFTNLNSRFGTIAVPNIVIFHNAKAIARFNNTDRTFPAIKDFIINVTSIKPNESIRMEEVDYIGPLQNVPTQETDYFLILSWMFIFCFTSFQVGKSSLGQRVLTAIHNFGHYNQQADL